MKLLRYGPSGAEKPALLDAQGAIRCLSSVVRDIDGFALSDAALQMLAGSIRRRCRRSMPPSASAPASRGR